MKIDGPLIDHILKHYPIKDWSDMEHLDSGFHTDNVKIKTELGMLVIRRIHDHPAVINRMMFLYEYLSNHDFPTAGVIKTLDDKYFLNLADQNFAIQQFIDGQLPISDTKEQADDISKKVAICIGELHALLSRIDLEDYRKYSPEYEKHDIISWLLNAEIRDDGIVFPLIHKPLEDEFVIKEYKSWLQELKNINLQSLSQGICHNDLMLAAFRFNQEGEISGVLDFGSAEYSYHLYDIASYMMYTGMYEEQIAELFFTEFIQNYLKTATMEKSEFRHLRFFIKARFLLQVFYFYGRMYSENIQGVGSNADNMKGFNDGIAFLEHLHTIPQEYYDELLGLK